MSGRMAYLMAVAPASTPTEVCILDSRKRRKNTARATKGGQMETSTMESGKMVHSMVTAHTREPRTEACTMENLWMARNMAGAPSSLPTDACTSENFKMA